MLIRAFFGASHSLAESTVDARIGAWLRTGKIDGATVYRAFGLWFDEEEGETCSEPALVVEIDGAPRENVYSLLREIKRALGEKAVLVQEIPTETTLL